MCGIIGSLSEEYPVLSSLINGLDQLQNRGYDSMGISLLDQNFEILKQICTNEPNLLQYLGKSLMHNTALNGIAHSRWATHGKVSVENAHPHNCYQGIFTLVHNGIIENFKELREILYNDKITFRSETDTEVIVNLISWYFNRLTSEGLDLLHSISTAISYVSKILKGTFALVIQCKFLPNNLFCIRFGSPMLIGFSPNLTMAVSEKSAFVKEINRYIVLNNHDLIILYNNGTFKQYETEQESYILKAMNDRMVDEYLDTEKYRTWTEKEIFEQPEAIRRALNYGSRILPELSGVQLGGLSVVRDQIRSVKHLILCGCGTSYHACLLVSIYFRKLTNLYTVQVADGSEFESDIISKDGKSCMIVVSQSGETIDLVRSIEKFRKMNPDDIILGAINVVDSLISTMVDAGVYINCGKERGVASTKSFTTQVVILFLICVFLSDRSLLNSTIKPLLHDLIQLPNILENNLPKYSKSIKEKFANYVGGFKNLFIIGKSFDYYIAMESSLKIKEINYIHSEAYSSSSLKHGPFALLDKDMLVILINSSELERKKIENAYEEISARRSPILLISYENINQCPHFIEIAKHNFAYIEANCILQMIAHEISLLKDINPDFPRNLAKVVTVE